eukprot:gnl/Chilomastix_cuspidata/1335.p1 GENE.gnl/Chilomastix_cuspidata/1335~~gnl/Chilomastix_cuspidata/1335.p1  ORF type:complete len:578 (+),score=283.74 gnl/Chilomastix_cuspidata/1335:24-1736(+)
MAAAYSFLRGVIGEETVPDGVLTVSDKALAFEFPRAKGMKPRQFLLKEVFSLKSTKQEDMTCFCQLRFVSTRKEACSVSFLMPYSQYEDVKTRIAARSNLKPLQTSENSEFLTRSPKSFLFTSSQMRGVKERSDKLFVDAQLLPVLSAVAGRTQRAPWGVRILQDIPPLSPEAKLPSVPPLINAASEEQFERHRDGALRLCFALPGCASIAETAEVLFFAVLLPQLARGEFEEFARPRTLGEARQLLDLLVTDFQRRRAEWLTLPVDAFDPAHVESFFLLAKDTARTDSGSELFRPDTTQLSAAAPRACPELEPVAAAPLVAHCLFRSLYHFTDASEIPDDPARVAAAFPAQLSIFSVLVTHFLRRPPNSYSQGMNDFIGLFLQMFLALEQDGGAFFGRELDTLCVEALAFQLFRAFLCEHQKAFFDQTSPGSFIALQNFSDCMRDVSPLAYARLRALQYEQILLHLLNPFLLMFTRNVAGLQPSLDIIATVFSSPVGYPFVYYVLLAYVDLCILPIVERHSKLADSSAGAVAIEIAGIRTVDGGALLEHAIGMYRDERIGAAVRRCFEF